MDSPHRPLHAGGFIDQPHLLPAGKIRADTQSLATVHFNAMWPEEFGGISRRPFQKTAEIPQ
jgi:hypothetical protein